MRIAHFFFIVYIDNRCVIPNLIERVNWELAKFVDFKKKKKSKLFKLDEILLDDITVCNLNNINLIITFEF